MAEGSGNAAYHGRRYRGGDHFVAAMRFLGSVPTGVDLWGGLHGAVVTDLDQDGLAEVIPIRFSFPGEVELPIPVLEFQSLTQLSDLSGTILTSGRPVTDFGRQIVVTDLNRDGWEDILSPITVSTRCRFRGP